MVVYFRVKRIDLTASYISPFLSDSRVIGSGTSVATVCRKRGREGVLDAWDRVKAPKVVDYLHSHIQMVAENLTD